MQILSLADRTKMAAKHEHWSKFLSRISQVQLQTLSDDDLAEKQVERGWSQELARRCNFSHSGFSPAWIYLVLEWNKIFSSRVKAAEQSCSNLGRRLAYTFKRYTILKGSVFDWVYQRGRIVYEDYFKSFRCSVSALYHIGLGVIIGKGI